MIRLARALGGGTLIAIGTSLVVYNVLGFGSRTLVWDRPERAFAAVGAGLIVVGVLLYRAK